MSRWVLWQLSVTFLCSFFSYLWIFCSFIFFLEMHKELSYTEVYLHLSFTNLDLCNELFHHVLPPWVTERNGSLYRSGKSWGKITTLKIKNLFIKIGKINCIQRKFYYNFRNIVILISYWVLETVLLKYNKNTTKHHLIKASPTNTSLGLPGVASVPNHVVWNSWALLSFPIYFLSASSSNYNFSETQGSTS